MAASSCSTLFVVLLIEPVRRAQEATRFGGIRRFGSRRCQKPLRESRPFPASALRCRATADRRTPRGSRGADRQRPPRRNSAIAASYSPRARRAKPSVYSSRRKQRRLRAVVVQQRHARETARRGRDSARPRAAFGTRSSCRERARGFGRRSAVGACCRNRYALAGSDGIECPRGSKSDRRLAVPAGELVRQAAEQMHVRALRIERARRRKLPQRIVDSAPLQKHRAKRHAHAAPRPAAARRRSAPTSHSHTHGASRPTAEVRRPSRQCSPPSTVLRRRRCPESRSSGESVRRRTAVLFRAQAGRVPSRGNDGEDR